MGDDEHSSGLGDSGAGGPGHRQLTGIYRKAPESGRYTV